MEWFDRGKMVILRLTDLGIALLALGIILQLLFGNAMPFLGNDIAANIMTFIKGLGGQGLVGLVAIAVVVLHPEPQVIRRGPAWRKPRRPRRGF